MVDNLNYLVVKTSLTTVLHESKLKCIWKMKLALVLNVRIKIVTQFISHKFLLITFILKLNSNFKMAVILYVAIGKLGKFIS